MSRFKELEEGERGLLANARCLSEGVDVPTLDGVAFIDPRRSQVDIVQAVGRAIRKAQDKQIGTVIIPVFIEDADDAESALETSVFKPIWDVLKALRAHDDALANELDALRREIGRMKGTSELPRPSKIHLDLPSKVGLEFAKAFDLRLVEQTTASWEFWYGLLLGYIEREGHGKVPSGHSEHGHRLNTWAEKQRCRNRDGTLLPERKHRLDRTDGWIWEPYDFQWFDGYSQLLAFVKREGHARVPYSHKERDGFVNLGTWVSAQRSRRTELSDEKRSLLVKLPRWSWADRNDRWKSGYSALMSFVEREGHALVPVAHVEGDLKLGVWVNVQRTKRKTLSADRRRKLETVAGWVWDARAAMWEEGFGYLMQFVERTGTARVPKKFLEGEFRLGNWVEVNRANYKNGILPNDRVKRLEVLPGWAWNARDARWTEGFEKLLAFLEREGHARVPISHKEDGYNLGNWTNNQRQAYKRGQLNEYRFNRLDNLDGWLWDASEFRDVTKRSTKK